MQGPFVEDFNGADHGDPLDGHGYADFDWPGLEAALGEATADLDDADMRRLSTALDKLMWGFIVGAGPIRPGKAASVGRKCLAVCWLLWPDRFEGRSLTRLAGELGVSPATLAVASGDFSREFGIRFRQQCQSSGVFRNSSDDDALAKKHVRRIHATEKEAVT